MALPSAHVGAASLRGCWQPAFGLEQPPCALGLHGAFASMSVASTTRSRSHRVCARGLAATTLTQDDSLLTAASPYFDGLLASFDKSIHNGDNQEAD